MVMAFHHSNSNTDGDRGIDRDSSPRELGSKAVRKKDPAEERARVSQEKRSRVFSSSQRWGREQGKATKRKHLASRRKTQREWNLRKVKV